MSYTQPQDSNHHDAYAGQYPTPPQQYPPVSHTPESSAQYYPMYPSERSQQNMAQPYPQYQDAQNHYTAPSYPTYQDQGHTQPYPSYANAAPAPPHSTTPSQPYSYHTMPGVPTPNYQSNDIPSSSYNDPHAVPLTDYWENDHDHYPGRQDVDTAALLSHKNGAQSGQRQQAPLAEEEEFEEVVDMSELQEPKHVVAPASYNRPDRDGFLPGERRRGAKPGQQGPMDPESYLPKPYKEPRMGCCRNMSCCSVFCLLISVAFVVAGAVLMIYAKVAKGNCDNAASGHSTVQSMCDTVLYDGLFYGGIVVMAISGLVTLWRLIMCMCGGRR
ncbi:hypothetical protein INT43_007287 [Umbelopsis isabellina]|uniref:Uncharacterized protein n=1 Tax=Mortierella isabellina TaxID=91625 RepID=A0A8H7PY10_MORIS|nr:hypothetical protein INT43_007287 [Umbelopsis isabellina]